MAFPWCPLFDIQRLDCEAVMGHALNWSKFAIICGFVDAYAGVNVDVNAYTKDIADADANATVPLMLLYI